MKRKKILNAVTAIAVSLSICCIPDNITYTDFSIISQTNAADSNISFDSASGTLYISGAIDHYEMSNFSEKKAVKSIVAKEGTIFPEDSSYLLSWLFSATAQQL